MQNSMPVRIFNNIAGIISYTNIWCISKMISIHKEAIPVTFLVYAQGTYIGRPYIYGLGAYGEKGVKLTLELIQKELDISMALCGYKNIQDVDSSAILLPKDFGQNWS